MAAACPACGCERVQGLAAHAVRSALLQDDLDRALALGLLAIAVCAGCDPACTAALQAARSTRARALAARERFRARATRLARRAQERSAPRTASGDTADPARSTSALPAAAAAALARARAKAAARR